MFLMKFPFATYEAAIAMLGIAGEYTASNLKGECRVLY